MSKNFLFILCEVADFGIIEVARLETDNDRVLFTFVCGIINFFFTDRSYTLNGKANYFEKLPFAVQLCSTERRFFETF